MITAVKVRNGNYEPFYEVIKLKLKSITSKSMIITDDDKYDKAKLLERLEITGNLIVLKTTLEYANKSDILKYLGYYKIGDLFICAKIDQIKIDSLKQYCDLNSINIVHTVY